MRKSDETCDLFAFCIFLLKPDPCRDDPSKVFAAVVIKKVRYLFPRYWRRMTQTSHATKKVDRDGWNMLVISKPKANHSALFSCFVSCWWKIRPLLPTEITVTSICHTHHQNSLFVATIVSIPQLPILPKLPKNPWGSLHCPNRQAGLGQNAAVLALPARRAECERKARLELQAKLEATYPMTHPWGWLVYGCFLKWWHPQIIHFNRVFHYKPSILGYHHLRKHPYLPCTNLTIKINGIHVGKYTVPVPWILWVWKTGNLESQVVDRDIFGK